MDRRRHRFMPTSDGLETRELMSGLFGGSNSVGSNPATDVPVTFKQKQLRVAHLPYYLENLQPGRYLSQNVITSLQNDLTSITAKLQKPDYRTTEVFNKDLRPMLTHNNLSPSDAMTLNHDFASVISTMRGITAQQITNLTNDMNSIALIDSKSRQPVYLATNDYSTILQTLLGVARPIQTPLPAQIALADGTRADTRHGITDHAKPRFVGTYGVGDTVGPYAGDPLGGFNSNNVIMQIVDKEGALLGQGKINPINGDYVVQIHDKLAPGTYIFYTRALDPEGHFSNVSPPYAVKVVNPHKTAIVNGQATPAGPAT